MRVLRFESEVSFEIIGVKDNPSFLRESERLVEGHGIMGAAILLYHPLYVESEEGLLPSVHPKESLEVLDLLHNSENIIEICSHME